VAGGVRERERAAEWREREKEEERRVLEGRGGEETGLEQILTPFR